MAADRGGTFGGKLRAARERRGVPLREIANKTKISVGVLEALERNDFSRLPGGIFSRAFVRSYAIEVGLDPDEAIQDFLAELPRDAAISVSQTQSDQIEDGESLESDRRMATTFMKLIALSIPIAGAVLYFGGGIRRTANATLQPEETSPRAAARTDGRSIRAVEPASREGVPADDRRATAPSPDATVPAAQPIAPAVNRLTVALSASRACWISATVDGSTASERLLQPGDVQTFDVRRDLVLKAGDAEALSMKVNGVPAKSLGNAGQVITVRLNLSNFKDYLISQ